ncbi:MAG: hypothetical protein RR942_01385 [Romboutsia sp.]
MAKRTVKCPKCGQENNKEDAIKQGNRYYCSDCIEDIGEYKELISYVCELYRVTKPSMLIVKQVKDFKDKYNFTNIGIQYTLKYYHEILNKSVMDDKGIGIVPYYYDQAKYYYKNKFNLEELAEGFCGVEKVQKRRVENKSHLYRRKDIDISIDWSEAYEE